MDYLPSRTLNRFEPVLWLVGLACLSWFCFAGGLFIVTGCAARKNAGSPGAIHIPHDCLKSLNITPQTYCEADEQDRITGCYKASVTRIKGCGEVPVAKTDKGEKH